MLEPSEAPSARPSRPAILLGGGLISVSVARCLGPAGIAVWVLGDGARDTVNRSRYCTSFVDLGSGDGVQARWLDWLSARPAGEAVVFPCCDDGLELVCKHRARLVELGYLPIEANDKIALAMLDKLETYALARKVGIETPRHFALETVDTLDSAMAESGFGFPCALKPLQSHVFRRRFTQKALVAHDRDELVKGCREVARRQQKVMVTEIIPGPEDAYAALHAYFDEHGEPLVQLTKRKLRQYPVGFGTGTYHVTDWNDEVARLGLQFCQGVGIRGVGNPEFKRDARDGRFKLIECNHRFSQVNELLRRAGVNTPLLAYDRLLGRHVSEMSGYVRGMYLWFPSEDVKAFRFAHQRGQITSSAWIASLLRRQHLALFDREDPRPALASWRRQIVDLGVVAAGKIRRQS